MEQTVIEGTLDFHHDASGSTCVYRIDGKRHGAMYGVPLDDYLPRLAGQRFRLTIEALPSPGATMPVNPWREDERRRRQRRAVDAFEAMES